MIKNTFYDQKLGWLMSHDNPYLNYGFNSDIYFNCLGQSVLFYLTKPGLITISSDKLEIIYRSYHYFQSIPYSPIQRIYSVEITRLS